MKTKNIIQRNLNLNENYSFVSAKYIPIIEGNGCTCDNCGKLISNIVTIKDTKNKVYNVGSDCAETLQSLQKDYNYFQNKDSFNEGKQIRAKIQREVKKRNGSRWDIVKHYLYISKDSKDTYLVGQSSDGGTYMKQLFYPEITTEYIKDLLC